MTAGRVALALALMAAFGYSVYYGIGTFRHAASAAAPNRPQEVTSNMPIVGSMYLTQKGGLYRLQGNRFSELAPVGKGWTQPAVAPDHKSLAIVQRSAQFSDIVLVDLAGTPIRRLTQNGGRDVESSHWAFYPAFSPDATSIYFSLDSPKEGFRVDLNVWVQSLSNAAPRRWTRPNIYTGGDVAPVPLPDGRLIYAEYTIDADGRVYSQVLLQGRPLVDGLALTRPEDDCGQPTLSPDGTRLAMICISGQQARLAVADFDGKKLGPLQVLVDGRLCSAPAWQPDGKALAYLSPGGPAGRFQLWFLDLPAAGSPAGPARQLTTNLEFDATSRIAWF